MSLMMEFVMQHQDGYTSCQTFTNPPLTYWVGRDASTVPVRDVFEKAVAMATGWEPHDLPEILTWTWYRTPGKVMGIPVNAHLLQEMLEWVSDGVVTAEVELAVVTIQDGIQALAARIVDHRIAILAPCANEADKLQDMSLFRIVRLHSPMFGAPLPIRWFDEEGAGPIDGIEIMVQTLPELENSVTLTAHRLGAGGGSMTPAEARELARQLVEAAAWCEARKPRPGDQDGSQAPPMPSPS
jgi:hypothetical protein